MKRRNLKFSPKKRERKEEKKKQVKYFRTFDGKWRSQYRN
jgi:hypothetical protein